MPYVVNLPTRPRLRPDAAAAKRLAALLRELRATEEVIEVADRVADAADRDPKPNQVTRPTSSR